MASKTKGISEQELKSLIDQEAYSALGYIGKLTEQRRRALEYYEAKPTGRLSPPEVEGRSAVVSPDVANAVEWAMPSLMRIFASGDKVVQFEPRKPGDEAAADAATDYVNWLYWTQNEGWRVTYMWIKDALLSKNGIVKVYSEETVEVTQEDYTGLTDGQMAEIVGPDEVDVLNHSETPDEDDAEARQQAVEQLGQQLAQAQQAAQQNPQAAQAAQQIAAQLSQVQSTPPKMLHDISIKRTSKQHRLCVVNVPPEEFLISRMAKGIDDTPFVAHRVQRTLSDLIAAGYPRDQVMRLADDNNWVQYNSEAVERRVNDDEWLTQNTNQGQGADPLMRRVWLIESYVHCDFDGDGIAELRKVVKAGFEILENEMVDGNPFADMTPIIMPHRFFGKSLADVTMDWQDVKTALLRQLLDALYLGNNPRYEAVEGQVNFDDLLTARPGGVVRTKAPGQIAQLITQDVSGQALTGLQYIEQVITDRTGSQKNGAAIDPDALHNVTAAAASMAQNGALQKIELIARVFAETGFKRLFKLMLKEATRYQDKPAMIRLNGSWAEINPREWTQGFDLSISVGLGTGNRDQQAAQLKDLMMIQQALLQIGVATPQNIYATVSKLPSVLGYKNEDQFFTDPSKNPPPQHPDPEAAKAQAQMQVEQMKAQVKAQTDAQAKQAEVAVERERMQMQAQVDTHRQQVEAQQKALEAQNLKELEQIKLQAQMQLEQFKAEMQQQTAIAVAKINAEAQVMRAQLQASATPATATTAQDNAADSVVGDD